MAKKDQTPAVPKVRDPSLATPPDVLARYLTPIPAVGRTATAADQPQK